MSTTLSSVDIGQAERATRALLDRLLADVSVSFAEWVVLRALAAADERIERDAFVERIATQLRVDPSVVDDATVGLEEKGLFDARRALTTAGRERYATVLQGVTRTASELYGDFDPDDLATTHRVLVEVAARAGAMLERS